MQNQGSRLASPVSGSIFIWIFVMIALFGALSFALISSMRGASSSISKDKAKLIATQILQDSGKVQDAIKTLQISGCTETQISFQNSYSDSTTSSGANPVPPYQNATTPANNRCKVFHSSGGGLTFDKAPKEALELAKHTGADFQTRQYYAYISHFNFANMGANPDLTMTLAFVNPEVCAAINNLVGITGSINSSSGYNPDNSFNGTYANFGAVNPAGITGNRVGCYTWSSGANSMFYRILIVR